MRSERRRVHAGALVAFGSAGGERYLPGVGSGELVGDEALPECGLRGVDGLRVAEEEHVAEANDAGAIVLGERVLVEAREGGGEALLYLRGERRATVGPVDGDELGKLIGTLDDADESLGHQGAVRGVTRHLANEQERDVTQLHVGASLDGERGDLGGFDLRD